MDDFVILHDSKEFLWQIKNKIEKYLADLNLELHENKCRIFSVTAGVPFLGMVIYPTQRKIKRQNLSRYKQRLHLYQKMDRQGLIEWSKIHQSVQSWIGHVKHANTWRLRSLVLKDIVFQRQADN